VALALYAAPAAAQASEADKLREFVAFLASDDLKGRHPASPTYAVALDYVVAQFRAAGLQPGGSDGYVEPVPLVRATTQGPGAMTWTPRHGVGQPLVTGIDYFPGNNPGRPHAAVTAPAVFVGYGVSLPGMGHDDYAGLDVRGRIVAFVTGGPQDLRGEERGIVWDLRSKIEAAAAHGAVGAVYVQVDSAKNAVPFSISARVGARPEISWAQPDGMSRAGPASAPLLGTLSATGAAKIFGARWQANVRRGRSNVPHFLPIVGQGALSASTDTAVQPVPSGNVVALLPGTDPVLSNEIVVVSAHLDHLGVSPGEAGDRAGDRIYNGALDNAIGVAETIGVARRLVASHARPRRTILFLITTGEEAGLIGSDFFMHDAAMPLGRIVADVNIDMPILTYPFEDVIVFRGPHSTLGDTLATVLVDHGLPSASDPSPGDSLFIRSDQFSFARRGIPSVMIWPGRKGPGEAATDDFLAHHYHKPSDDMAQAIDWTAAARFGDIATAMVMAVSDAEDRPRWRQNDALGRAAGVGAPSETRSGPMVSR